MKIIELMRVLIKVELMLHVGGEFTHVYVNVILNYELSSIPWEHHIVAVPFLSYIFHKVESAELRF